MAGLTIKTIFSAVDKLTGPARTMTGSVDKFSASAKRSISGISSGVSRMRGLLMSTAAILTTGVIAKSITDFAEKGDEIGRIARTLGLTGEALQELQYAAKQADLPAEDLATAFKKMNNNLGELKGGSGALYTHLKKANPQLARQLRTVKDSDGAFMLLMDAISKETDVQKRASLAQAAFGKAGQNLIEMAVGGAEALAQLRKEAHASGSMISNQGVGAADNFTKSLKKMTSSIQYLKNAALEDLMRALTPVLEGIVAWTQANRELLKQKIHDAVDKIVAAAKKLYEIAEKVVSSWEKLNKAAGGKLLEDVVKLAIAWKAVETAIGLAKVAHVAYNLIPKGGGAAAGAAAGAAEGAIGSGAAKWVGRFAGGGAAAALGAGAMLAPPIAAAVVVGKSLLPMVKDPTAFMHAAATGETVQGGVPFLTDLFTKLAGVGLAIRGDKRKENEPTRVVIDFTNIPAGVSVRSSNVAGAPAATLRRGPAFVGPRP